MTNLQTLEWQIQQAILQISVEAYKQQQANWPAEPAIKKAILIDTLLSWQSLALGTTTILMVIFTLIFLKMYWIVAATVILFIIMFGFLAAVGWLWVNLNDSRRQSKALANHLQHGITFSLDAVHDKKLKVKLLKALHYWSLINDKSDTLREGPLRDRVWATHRDVTQWLQVIYNLTRQADALLLNTIVRQELQNLPVIIREYETKLLHEINPGIRRQLEQTITQRQQQLQTLQSLQNHIAQVHYQLDSTLSALGMVYSQLLLIAEEGRQTNRMRHLHTEVTEEINRLQDLIEAIYEVQQNKTTPTESMNMSGNCEQGYQHQNVSSPKVRARQVEA